MVDILWATASDLQRLLEEGKTNSHALVEAYLEQIDRHNRNGLCLNAIVSVVPSSIALRMADKLDEERRNDRTRGPLHGIPIIVKDAIVTGSEFGVPTTLGCCAFEDAMGHTDAHVVRLLRENGLIIIGKASMTQLHGWKGTNVTTGWSPLSGQTQSAFIEGGVQEDVIFGHSTPGGSSSGSGVGVSAGFSPVALGTETDGSIVGPAHRAGLYALKPHAGSVNMDGTYALTEWESIGPLAKSAADVAALLNVIMEPCPAFNLDRLKEALWQELRIGFVDPSLWRLPPSICAQNEGVYIEFDEAFFRVRDHAQKAGAYVKSPIALPASDVLLWEGGNSIHMLVNQEMKRRIEEFASWIVNPKVKTLNALVEFNKANSDREMPPGKPDQKALIAALEDQYTDEYARTVMATVGKRVTDGLERILGSGGVDVVVAPGDSPVTSWATCAGYPVATVPVGQLSVYGRPYGLTLLAKRGCEHKLLHFMHAFNRDFPDQQIPPRLSGTASYL